MKNKEEYLRAMQSKLEKWNADIDVLTGKTSDVSAEVRAEYNGRIAVLKIKQAAAKQKIEELHKSEESAWHDLKAGIDLAWSAIGEAVDSAKSRFK